MDSMKMDTTNLRVFVKFFAIASVSICIILVAMSVNRRDNLTQFNTGEEKRQGGSMEKNGLHLDDEHLGRGKVKRATATPGDPLLFSADEQQNLLDLHNSYRRQVSPEASNMEFMIWDTQLAEWAQEWTDACYYEHGFPAAADNVAVGQNLWRGFVAIQPNGTGPINSWWNEWRWYDYDTNTCQEGKICGHYTQLTWDTSSKIGCGRSFCAEGYDDTLNFTDNYIVACNYLEQGNKRGIKPYETGASCTRCTSGVMMCDDKLCRQCQAGDTAAECSTTCEANCQNCATLNANCTCTCQPQFTGVDCSAACGDYDESCGTGWPPITCGGAIPGFEFVDELCPAMCGLCTPDDGSFVCDIDHCDPNPCMNGATCTDGIDSFTCACNDGYNDSTCATDIDDCDPNPCMNGATCTDGVDSFTCTCATGYSDSTCLTDIDDCDPNPCMKGATCTDGVDSFTCTCAAGYTDKLIFISRCRASSCRASMSKEGP